LDYAIIHPGGLVDTPGGVEEFVLDVDDNLASTGRHTAISREDVAEMCVAALGIGSGQNISFDCITQEVVVVDNDDDKQDTPPNKKLSAEEALLAFMEQSKSANYAL
jgi:hypothetical protein